MNTKVKTWVGTVVIIIIAITVGVFVWLYEKNQPEIAQLVQINVLKKVDKTADLVPSGVKGWQTYRNDKYGFEFKYPKSWTILESGEDNALVLSLKSNKAYSFENSEINPITIDYRKDIYAGSIDKFITSAEIKKIMKQETVDIAGGKSYVFQGVTPPIYHDFRVLFASGYVFNFNNNGGNISAAGSKDDGDEINKIFNQILSTFKFIN